MKNLVDRVCDHCNGPLTVPAHQMLRGRGRFCSVECMKHHRVGRPTPGFITPPSDKKERIRANGLVNKRLKLGWFAVPDQCMKCGQAKRLVSHHQDYRQPESVHWICYTCHQLVHFTPNLLDGIAPFICGDRRTDVEKPNPHCRGGWKGTRDNAHRLRRSKATMDQARQIRSLATTGMTQQALAKQFHLSQMTICRIVRNERMRESAPLQNFNGLAMDRGAAL